MCSSRRRRLLLSSMAGVVAALLLLGAAFHVSVAHVPPVIASSATTCAVPDLADCADCLRHGCVADTVVLIMICSVDLTPIRFRDMLSSGPYNVHFERVLGRPIWR